MTREWERLRRSTNRKSVGLTFEYAPRVGSLFKERINYQGKVDKKYSLYPVSSEFYFDYNVNLKK